MDSGQLITCFAAYNGNATIILKCVKVKCSIKCWDLYTYTCRCILCRYNVCSYLRFHCHRNSIVAKMCWPWYEQFNAKSLKVIKYPSNNNYYISFCSSSFSSLNESTGSLNRSYNDISDQDNGIYVIVRWVKFRPSKPNFLMKKKWSVGKFHKKPGDWLERAIFLYFKFSKI